MAIFDSHSYLGGSRIPGIATNANAIQTANAERGIHASLVFSTHARRVDPLAGNRILKANIDQSPSLFGCLTTHVNRVEASVTAMKDMMVHKKMLAMVVAGSRDDDPVTPLIADEIINAYRRYSKPLVLFVNNDAMVESALEIAKKYTMIKILFLGMGGDNWRSAIAAAHSHTNIYLETSGALDRSKIPEAVEALGPHRIIFGSGSPRVDPAAAIGLLQDAAINPEIRKRILYDNALRLFGLSAT